jgi:gentisate 1,2-dioxygenase
MNSAASDPSRSAARERYYQRIGRQHMTPLWEVLHALVPPAPNSVMQAALWRYREIRAAVLEAGELISAEEAERRVLILENPGARGESRITQTLYAGLQLILPGEVAPAHRHAQTALRLVLEGEGAYTAVDGERRTMRRGDFIITPSWTWHDHGNEGREPVVWLDGLDIPLLQSLGVGFAEKALPGARVQAELRPEGEALARYGHNLVPMDAPDAPSAPSPLWVFPFAGTRAALDGIAKSRPDAHFGHKLRFVNPATGRSPMPTMGTYVTALPKGFESLPSRSTDAGVYACLEGEGSVEIAGTRLDFEPNDVFVVPTWQASRWHAHRDCILFSYSDRPVQQALGLWREEKMEAA